MTAELFNGTYEALETRLNVIIGGGAVINNVIVLAKGQYIILFT